MGNMSYCRFENTRQDLNDCLNALHERNISSKREKDEAYKLLITVLDFCMENDIIDSYNTDIVEEIIEECESE